MIRNSQKNLDYCPAYKGLAYIVFQDFPLGDYGNKLPSFLFEVERDVWREDENSITSKICGLNIIPGSGEFVYDTIIQHKTLTSCPTQFQKINCNNKEKIADALYSLNYLVKLCPKVKWASPVVSWFVNSIDIADCEIFPAVEFKDSSQIYSEEWKVSKYIRETTYLISRDSVGNPNYGGTVNDASVIRYLKEIKSRGLKIMFYPVIFVDLPGKPWRGHITGSSDDVIPFFRKENGYNEFILHYAYLVKDYVDAFIIGSELKSITSIAQGDNFPAVQELCLLAKQVKEIMGQKVKVSYAADWSEYHHTSGGWYHLDNLWGSTYIDFVGIDNYMPLTYQESVRVSDEEIIKGFDSGEGFDFYIHEDAKYPLNKEYAWKNLDWWWNNYHVNPDGNVTSWIPRSKKIWFTEYGFPTIDKATNQPNVFFDPNCTDGGVPRFSNSNTDFAIQKKAIKYFIEYWETKEYIENMFLWCFDARPYPAWPHSKIWKDSYLWEKGHWINGKFAHNCLSDIITEISERCEMQKDEVDVSMLDDEVCGFALTKQYKAIEVINILRSLYFFDIRDRVGGGIYFIKRYVLEKQKIDAGDILSKINDSKIEEISPNNCAWSIFIRYRRIEQEYQYFTEIISKDDRENNKLYFLNLPFSLSKEEARNIGERLIANSYTNYIEFNMPITHILSVPNDVLEIILNEKKFVIKIIKVKYAAQIITISGVVEIASTVKINKPVYYLGNNQNFEGEILQVIFPQDFADNVEDSSNNYVYFVNLFPIRMPLCVSYDKMLFNKIADIEGGSCALQITNCFISSDIQPEIIDDQSFIDVVILQNCPNYTLRSLWDFSSMMICKDLIFFGADITILSENRLRISKFIYNLSNLASPVFPDVGDEILLLNKMAKIEFVNSAYDTELFYNSYKAGEIKNIILPRRY